MAGSQADAEGRQRLPFIVWLPVILLVVVAVNQMRLALTGELTSWKGGGFGMFATTDRPGTRYVHVWLIGEGRDRPVPVPAAARRAELSARANPTERNLLRLAQEVAKRLPSRSAGVRAVRVEYWPRSFHPDSPTLRVRKKREVTYSIP